MTTYKILYKSTNLYKVIELPDKITIEYDNYIFIIENYIKLWKSKYKSRITSVLIQRSYNLYILVVNRSILVFNINRPVIRYDAEYISPGITTPIIYTKQNEYDPIERMDIKNNKRFDVVILHAIDYNTIRKQMMEKYYDIKNITIKKSMKFKYPWYIQLNNYFLLKIPNYFEKEHRGKYLPCDAKLVNLIKWMWDKKIITRTWNEPHDLKLGYISFNSEFKSFIMINLKDEIKIKEYDMKKINHNKTSKQINDIFKILFKPEKNILHYQITYSLDKKHKHHVIRFSDSILKKIHKVLQIEYPDITKALPGFKKCEKYLYDNFK